MNPRDKNVGVDAASPGSREAFDREEHYLNYEVARNRPAILVVGRNGKLILY